jgi:hypothetical protein
MSTISTIYHYEPTAPLRLYTDASNYGIGGYLCQVVRSKHGQVLEEPLGFISKSLTDTECRWSVYEKEAYAIFYCFTKWEHFLRSNKHFHLFTDHKNLTFLNNPPSQKVMRWRLAVQDFNFSIAYIKGEENNVADAMSRCVPSNMPATSSHVPDDTDPVRPTIFSYLTGAEEIPGRRADVPEHWYDILDAKSYHQYDLTSSRDLSIFLGLIAEDAISDIQIYTPASLPLKRSSSNNSPGSNLETYLITSTKDQGDTFLYTMLCSTISTQPTVHETIPGTHELVQHETLPLPPMIYDLISKCHNVNVGHGGVDRTIQLLRQLKSKDSTVQHLFDSWPTLRSDVRRFVRTCPICQKVKQHQMLKFTPHFKSSTYGIFDNLSIDTIYMPKSDKGNQYLLVIIDSFSRYMDLYPISELSAKTAMECMVKFISNFGVPSHLCCDGGSQFQGLFQELLKLFEVNQYVTQAYSHQENSIVERANKEILTVLRALVLEKRLSKEWDVLCYVAKRIINSRIHSAIGISPADLVFAGRVDLQRGSLFPYPPPTSSEYEADDYMQSLMEHQERMLSTAMKMQQEHDMARIRDKSHLLKTVFPIDSYVLAKPEKGPDEKTSPRWLGPYVILERMSRDQGDIYRCQHLSTGKIFDFRIDRLEPYYTYDDSNLHDVAYEVETVLDHRFNGEHKPAFLQLRVKWIGYHEPSWEPFRGNGLDKVGIVHEYLRSHRMISYIPQQFK